MQSHTRRVAALYLVTGLVGGGGAWPEPGPAPRLKVSENGRFLVKEDGTPFFWLGDTAWELFHRLDLEESERYLRDRAEKGFTVIQAVVLAEFGGLTVPNANGDLPLIDRDPTRPNERYFEHVDAVVEAASRLGVYIGMLPTWGDKWNRKWGEGPEIFTPENAEVYGEYLGRRYRDKPVVWILGGDRPPENEQHLAIVRAMAAGLRRGDEGRHLFTYHPSGGQSSAMWFHEDDWLSFNMIQSGHWTRNNANYIMIAADYARTPTKPCLDGEPCYEQIAVQFKPALGRFDDLDVRKAAYWAVFAGAHGHTYGANGIFQFYVPSRPAEFDAVVPWQEALSFPGAGQMRHLRALMESRPFLTRVPDQSLIVTLSQDTTHGDVTLGPEGEGHELGPRTAATSESEVPGVTTEAQGSRHVQATRDASGCYAMIYIPASGQTVAVDSSRLSGKALKAWWYNPRTGEAEAVCGQFAVGGRLEFTSPAGGPDWVLVLDDASRGFPAPGTRQPS